MKVQFQILASKAKNKKEEQMKELLQKEQLNLKTKNQRGNKMKATISFTLVMMTAILSFALSSCSENPVNSFSQNDKLQGTNSTLSENLTSSAENKRKTDFFESKFTINPGDYIYLHSGITGLSSITQYSVSNCGITKKDLYISASNIDASQSLPCSSNDYVLDDLMIENRSGETKTVEVLLYSINYYQLSSSSSGKQTSETIDSEAKEFQSSFKIEQGETIRFDNQTLPMGIFSCIKIRNMTLHAADICDRISYLLLEIPGPSGYYEACLNYDEEVKDSGDNFHALEITNRSNYVLSLDVTIYQ